MLSNFVKRLFKKTGEKTYAKIRERKNKSGDKRKCNVCNNTFNYFTKYHGGNDKIPEFRKRLDLVDSDRDQFGCPYCYSFDRERHLFLYFDKTGIWDVLRNARILHFAPERNLQEKIKTLDPKEYILGDFAPKNDQIIKLDATNIAFEDNRFDVVICNHVLEHIPAYYAAIKEIYRVLNKGGMAILQTPYSKLLKNNFEDENLNTDELRWFFYGEADHFRIFSEHQFFEDLRKAGFKIELLKHIDLFDPEISYYFGVNPKEDLVRVFKNDN